jgi:DNA-3-methyladenine glycosylase I
MINPHAVSKALKEQGWRFVGPTTVYAFKQAMGLINDHAAGCVVRSEAARSRKKFRVPSNKRPTAEESR